MTEALVVGVDAGGTSTRCVVATVDGAIVARGRAGGANPRSSGGPPSEALTAALQLARTGIDAIVPDDDERAFVHRVIYDELCRGIVRDDSRARYRSIIERLVARGAQGIVLGCTEIAMLVGAGDAAVPVYDTTLLHAQAAAVRALSGEPHAFASTDDLQRPRAILGA